ncbi:MAG: rhodanese-like domain-containing protein [Coleofasciculaceae cyanobacterium]
MKNNWFQKISRYQRVIAVVICLSFLSVGSISVAAMINQMDIPTFIASWSTKQVTVTQLQQGQLKPVVFIDVRSPDEYAEDHIGESRLIPLSDIEAGFGSKQIAALVQINQPPTIVLYCHSGQRSIKAYKQLENIKVNFVVLHGGIKAWREAVPRSQDARILNPIIWKSPV